MFNGGWGVLFERAVLFNLKKMIVSVLHKELEYKVEKLKYKSCSQGSKTNLNFQLVNKPSWISPHKVPHEVLQSRSINTVYHLLMKNN